ncbi:hypothetical protein [Pseudonocardia hydrocarbonoxydans]|uniref:PPE family domain-containing protein n=1 Tax=Pseudonocardia hydrocarbonoxydans TaxID=76726 RepID=A0A4Y3WLX5_9PSEU|nr:hypothetical protein [Pseudonocardia hydrocarbonoxydans]GEC19251.1 hypothetical protein PHY01_15340 [Pseudonocardia hydrocarbonoxydans]
MTAPIPWQQMTHAQLDAAVRAGPGPGASMAAEQLWRRVSEIVEAGEARMHAATSRSADGWQGGAGDAARSGLHQLNAWAREAATDAHNTVSAMLAQGVSAGRLRSSMPAPNTEQLAAARDAADVDLFDEGVQRGLLAVEEEARWRAESARRVMEDYHFHSLDNRRLMDFWTVPPTVVVEAATAAGGGPGGGGPGGTGFAPAGFGAAGPGAAGPGAAGLGAAGPAATGSGVAGSGVAGPGAVGGPVGAAVPVDGAGPATGGAAASGAGGSAPTGSAGGAGRGAGAGGGAGAAPGAAGLPPRPVASSPGGLASGAGSPTRTGAVPPIRGRADLPVGAGGRGPRAGPGAAAPSGAGVRPAVPRPPTPSPTWRDLVAGSRDAAAPRATEPAPRGGAPVRPELRAPVEPASRAAGGSGHGVYPPMAGAGGGGAGEGRRRPSYLVDDSGAFDVAVPYTDAVIGEGDRDPR